MDFVAISILFVILFVVSLLWRYWLNGILKPEQGFDFGINETEVKEEPQEYARYELGLIESVKTKKEPTMGLMVIPATLPKKAAPKKISQTTIEREVKAKYKRSIYVNKAFSLKITIAAKKITISQDEKKLYHVDTEKLKFKAYEKEPKINVELKFAEGDFKVNKTKKSQKLSANTDAVFDFMVTPLKAEDCVLTVVFSYTDKIPAPAKTTEKIIIDKTTTPEGGKTTTEHSEQTTTVPIQIVEKEIEIKSMDIVIKVKSILGLNANQVNLAKKSAAGIIAILILSYKLVAGDLEDSDAILAAVVSLLPIFGVEGVDKLIGATTGDESEETT